MNTTTSITAIEVAAATEAVNKAAAKSNAASKKLISDTVKAEKNDIFAKSIVQQLDALSTERQTWETTVYAKANDCLYSLLSKCLAVYQDKFLKGEKHDQRALRTELTIKLKAAKVKIQINSNTLTMLARFVFCSDRKRAHGYANVLTAAISQNISAEDLPNFIINSGGIEEIKRKMVKSEEAILRKTQVEQAKGKVDAEIELAKINPLAQVQITGLTGDYAVLLVKPGVDGTVSVLGSLSNVNEALVNALLVRMAKQRVTAEDEDAQLGKEVQDMFSQGAANEPVLAKAA